MNVKLNIIIAVQMSAEQAKTKGKFITVKKLITLLFSVIHQVT